LRFREIERSITQVTKIRTELSCGRTPWQLIRRPKGMETRDFNRKIRILRNHEAKIREKLPIYMLQ